MRLRLHRGDTSAGTSAHFKLQSHRNLTPASECTRPEQYKAQDLAHQFRTDVLQLRIDHRIPLPADLSAMHRRRFVWKWLARLPKPSRIALAEAMEIQDGEVSATFRWRLSAGPEIIIFDSVPGGAGYVGMFFNKFSARDLLKGAAEDPGLLEELLEWVQPLYLHVFESNSLGTIQAC